MKKLTFFLAALSFLIGTSAAGVKYVAVVETDIDARSGAAAELTSAEVALITAELRREAVNNLPQGAYSVMTSETVQSMGGAVLEECSDENCVITLGSKIGADYIVRGTISKLRARLTLSVEIYETENGTLLASSDPVRSESIDELVEKAAAACAGMYKKFAETQSDMRKPTAAAESEPEPNPKSESIDRPIKFSAGGGAFFANDFGGGLNWGDGVQLTIPYSGGGAYLFFDATYAEAFVGLSGGGGKWKSGNVSDTIVLPDMSRLYINIGVFAKYPVALGNIKLFPLVGIDYEAAISAELNADGYKYPFDGNGGHPNTGDVNALWFKFGGGADAALWEKMYIRAELLYGFRGTNTFEKNEADNSGNGAKTKSAGGLTIRVGAGINL